MSGHKFIADVLIRAGLVNAADLARAHDVQGRQSITLGRALAGLGFATESQVAGTIAKALHLEYLDGDLPDVDPAAADLLGIAFCRKHGVAPLAVNGRHLRVAVTNPLDYSALQDIEFITGKKALAVVVTETWLELLLRHVYREADAPVNYDLLTEARPAGEVEASAEGEFDLIDPALLAKDVRLPPIVKLVNLILSEAAKSGASDVHIEPQETTLHVRQRVDGLLRDMMTVPHHLQDATISRIKIMSGMDIAERRRPQDGRSRLRLGGRRIDLRVSTMPMQFGEKVVIRLLNSDKAISTLEQLDLSAENHRLFQGFLANPQGMILLTGPTGSGKTSTLYSAVNAIKSATNNIVTLEDPIEIQIPGVNQMQINTRAGVTFAAGLRSILRQDPNVILVGEIRDPETAEIALGAAQTGHLLLSTLHTNDAPATITRLYDLSIPPFLIAASLVGVVAQRLVRRVCPACLTEQPPGLETIERIGGRSLLPPAGRWVTGRGCDECGQSGFKGRIAVHEVLNVTDDVRELIANRAAEHVIRRAAMRAGMRTLLEDGIDKAARGLTTLDEVLRVVSLTDTTDYPRTVESSPPAAAEAEVMSRPLRVLAVEDSPTVSTVVKYFLELEGFDVLVAEDGLKGLETALRERPDVIVSDVNMPGMGGVEMVRRLRADARTAGVRIIMLTSESSVESEAEGLDAGADDYIVKPVEPRRLAARVKALRARSQGLSA